MTHITTTVTFDDLIAQHESELADLRESYEDVQDLLADEFGVDPDHIQTAPDVDDDHDRETLAGLIQTRQVINQSIEENQKRIALLRELSGHYDGDTFEIAMLTGEELMDVETTLRMDANDADTDMQQVQTKRKQHVVDAGVTDAPEGFPTDDDGSPVPSDAPSNLMLSLYQAVETFNSAGTVDFRAPGAGTGPGIDSSDALTGIATSSGSSDSTDTSTAASGENSADK